MSENEKNTQPITLAPYVSLDIPRPAPFSAKLKKASYFKEVLQNAFPPHLQSNYDTVLDEVKKAIDDVCKGYDRPGSWIGNGHHFAQNVSSAAENKLLHINLTWVEFHYQQRLFDILDQDTQWMNGLDPHIVNRQLKDWVDQIRSTLRHYGWSDLMNRVYMGCSRISESPTIQRQTNVDWEALPTTILDSIHTEIATRSKHMVCLDAAQIDLVMYHMTQDARTKEKRKESIQELFANSFQRLPNR